MPSLTAGPKRQWERLTTFWREIKMEMKKVTFPGQKEVYGTTIMVIVSSFVLAVFLWVADYIFQKIIMFIFEKFGA